MKKEKEGKARKSEESWINLGEESCNLLYQI